MRLSSLKRPRAYIPLGLAVLTLVVALVVFHPAFQRKMLLDHVGPLVESLAIEHVHLTPWSLDLKGVAVRYAGGDFRLDKASIGFCLSSLVTRTIDLQAVVVERLIVDLKDFRPPANAEPASAPFPGLLASFDHGLGLRLQRLLLDGKVLRSDRQSVIANLRGGGIEPDASGAIDLAIRIDTGDHEDHFDIKGQIAVNQRSHGKLEAIDSDLDLEAVLAALPQPERVHLKATVSPARVEPADPPARPDDEGSRVAPEALQLALSLKGSGDRNRSAIELKGVYDGNKGLLVGDYQVSANEALVHPYLPGRKLPPAAEALHGEVRFNIATLTGDMTLLSDLLVTELRSAHANETLPERLRLKNDLRLTLRPGNELQIEALDTGLYDEAEKKALASKLPSALQLPLNDIKRFLKQDRTVLELELPEIPMAWFNVLLPDYEITSGVLRAAFEVATDASGAVHLVPTKPFQVSNLSIRKQAQSLVEAFNLSALPRLTYSEAGVSMSVADIKIDAPGGPVATASLNAAVGLGTEGHRAITTQGTASVDAKGLLRALAIDAAGVPPGNISLDYATAIDIGADTIRVKDLGASLSRGTQSKLLELELQKPLAVRTGAEGPSLEGSTGELAKIAIRDLDFAWLSAFVPGTTLQGRLSDARFSLAAGDRGTLTLTSSSPTRIKGLTLSNQEGALVDPLDISLKPALRYSSEGAQVSYADLSVRSRTAELLSATGTVTVPSSAGGRLAGDGRIGIDLQAIAGQPVIAKALLGPIESPLRLEADYSMSRDQASIDVSRLAVNLFYGDPLPRISLRADPSLRFHTDIQKKKAPLGRASGRIVVDVARLSPEPFAKVLEAHGLAFSAGSGKATVTSDGTTLSVDTIEPFQINGIHVTQKGRDLLRPFRLQAVPRATVRGDEVRAKLGELSIRFDNDRGPPTIDAKIELTLKRGLRLEAMSSDLVVSLPQLLDQPALLPGHSLTGGELRSKATLYPGGNVQASTRIQGLQGRDELALRAVDVPVQGRMDPNGGFAFTAPIKGQGRSGDTDLVVNATYAPEDDEAVQVTIAGKVFYLNDILSTLSAIAGEDEARAEGSEGTPKEPSPEQVAASKRPDPKAFWDQSPKNTRVELNVDRLFYTDYLEIHDIRGRLDLSPERLTAADCAAHFHDSAITLDAIMGFAAGTETPYDLKLNAAVERFNLAEFFKELVPGSTPRAEGLFQVELDAFGRSQNLTQYRNHLFFDLRLQSRDGVFRPLKPDSVLVAGSSNVAGAFGEGLSYVPTGLFGVGAVSRLVNYIKEVPYDRIDIHVLRDASRDLQIKQYLVQSPNILFTAKGGIAYQEGKDVLESPLSLAAQLNMRRKGAAILHSLDLLKPKKDSYGYWYGPEIKVSGTLGAAESNLEEIIATAGNGAVVGGITRPISGLVGNIKYDWLDEGEPIDHDGGQQ